MRRIIAGLAAAPLIGLSLSAHAGLWDDVKGVVDDTREVVDDVKGTREEAKGTVEDAKGLVKDTSDDVEGAIPEREAAAPPPRAVAPPPPSAAPPPPPSAAPPPPPSARTWHVDAGGGQTQQVSEPELAQMIRAGRVGPDTHVYGDSLGEWTAARQVPALKRYFAD